ncbi:MAG: hypothetical protein ACK5CL_08865 [Sphingomonadales bacterium]|jgi:hypothetical protein
MKSIILHNILTISLFFIGFYTDPLRFLNFDDSRSRNTDAAIVAEPQLEEFTPADFTNSCFRGKINDKYNIEMHLDGTDGFLSGYYQYKSIGKRIKIHGETNEDGSWFLKEFDNSGNQTGVFELYSLDSNIIEGVWYKPDGSSAMPFILVAEKPLKKAEQQLCDTSYPALSYLNGAFACSGIKENKEITRTLAIEYIGLNKFQYSIEVADAFRIIDFTEGQIAVDSSGNGKTDNPEEQFLFKIKKESISIKSANPRSKSSFTGLYFRLKFKQQSQFYTLR